MPYETQTEIFKRIDTELLENAQHWVAKAGYKGNWGVFYIKEEEGRYPDERLVFAAHKQLCQGIVKLIQGEEN